MMAEAARTERPWHGLGARLHKGLGRFRPLGEASRPLHPGVDQTRVRRHVLSTSVALSERGSHIRVRSMTAFVTIRSQHATTHGLLGRDTSCQRQRFVRDPDDRRCITGSGRPRTLRARAIGNAMSSACAFGMSLGAALDRSKRTTGKSPWRQRIHHHEYEQRSGRDPSAAVSATARPIRKRGRDDRHRGTARTPMRVGTHSPCQRPYISLRPSSARPRVTTSAYSTSPPIGIPCAIRLTVTPSGLINFAR